MLIQEPALYYIDSYYLFDIHSDMGTFLEINILFFITFKMCSHNPKGGKIQVRGYDTHTHTCALVAQGFPSCGLYL